MADACASPLWAKRGHSKAKPVSLPADRGWGSGGGLKVHSLSFCQGAHGWQEFAFYDAKSLAK
jgi:hypothetical protein